MKKLIPTLLVLAVLLCLCACAPAEEEPAVTTIPFETIGCQHNYEKTVGTAATCDKEGVMNLKCIYCKAETTEAIPANGHDFANATCTAPKTCLSCGATEGSTLPHTYDDNGLCIDCSTPAGSKKAIADGVWRFTDNSDTLKQYTLNVKAKTLSVAFEDTTGASAAITCKGNGDTATVTGEGFTLTLERVSDISFKVAAVTGENAVLPPVDAILNWASK